MRLLLNRRQALVGGASLALPKKLRAQPQGKPKQYCGAVADSPAGLVCSPTQNFIPLVQFNGNVSGLSLPNVSPFGPNPFSFLLHSSWHCCPPGPGPDTGCDLTFTPLDIFYVNVGAHNGLEATCDIEVYQAVPYGTQQFNAHYIPLPNSQWHVLISVNTDLQIVQLYVNDVPYQPVSGGWIGSGQMPGEAGPGVATALDVGSFSVYPAVADIWEMATPGWVDLTVVANRRKFINADLSPVDLGANGQTPMGTPPNFFLTAASGVPTDIAINKGTSGGVFNINLDGPLTMQAPGTCPCPTGLTIVMMDDGGHFWYSSAGPPFTSWAYTINAANTNSDTWNDMKMALNDGDYNTILALDTTPGGSWPSGYILASGPSGIASAPIKSLGAWTSGGSDSCGLTAFGTEMIFPIVNAGSGSPVLVSANGGVSFSTVSGLPTSTDTYWSPAFNQGGTVAYIHDGKAGGQTWKSVSSGATWTLLGSSPSTPAVTGNEPRVTVACSQNGNVVGVALGSGPGASLNVASMNVSSDGGLTWNHFDAAAAWGVPFVGYITFAMSVTGSVMLLLVAKDDNVTETGAAWISTNQGASWTSVTLPSAASRAATRCGVMPDGSGMVVGYRVYSGGNFVDHYVVDWSMNGGATWQTSALPTFDAGLGGPINGPNGIFMVP
jgi:hypothetical protein